MTSRQVALVLLFVLLVPLSATANCSMRVYTSETAAGTRVTFYEDCWDFQLDKILIFTAGDLVAELIPGLIDWILEPTSGELMIFMEGVSGASYVFDETGEYYVRGVGREYTEAGPSPKSLSGFTYTVHTVSPAASQAGSAPTASTTEPGRESASDRPPLGLVTFGGYSLELTDLIKCASVQERPYTAVIVSAVGGESWVHVPDVLLDSGADISILPTWIADALGIDLSHCEVREYHGVGGGIVQGYLTKVQIGITHLGGIDPDVDGYILADDGEVFLPVISVAFVGDDSNYILGREDVFDVLDLSFTSDTVIIRVVQD